MNLDTKIIVFILCCALTLGGFTLGAMVAKQRCENKQTLNKNEEQPKQLEILKRTGEFVLQPE